MISEEHRCIFVHIPKTGGTSIGKKLGHFEEFQRDVQDHRPLREIEPLPLRRILARLNSLEDLYLLARRVRHCSEKRPTRSQYQDYFKFSFVRNPWARVHSWYRNVMRSPKHRQRLSVPADCSFRKFLEEHPGQWALRPQMYWLKDWEGEIPFDFIGRFESLQQDFDKVGSELGISDTALPHMVRSEGGQYTQHYDEFTKRLVAHWYAEEIERFGYTFGD